MMNRRNFLTTVGAGVGTMTLPGFPAFAQSTASNGYKRLLILVELKGANDGLNTFIPYADDAYAALRPTIGMSVSSAGCRPNLSESCST